MKALKITVLLIAALAMVGGCATKKEGANFKEFAYGKDTSLDLPAGKHVKIARGYMARGEYEQAFVHLNAARQKSPDDVDIRALKGELLIGQRQDELALNEFVAVLEVRPDHAQANQGAGIIYFRAGLYEEAETHLERALSADGSLWKAHNYLGIIYDRRGAYDKAAESFAAALGMHDGQENASILNNLGVVHMARKDFELASRSFKQSLREGGGSARTYNNLGVALAHGGKLLEALEAFRFAGNEYVAHNNLGFVLLSSGQPRQAIPYFERALELSPSYYTRAAENLKRARMASRFGAPDTIVGSTPNQLSPGPFPSEGQAVDGAAEVVKPVAVPSSDDRSNMAAPVHSARQPGESRERVLMDEGGASGEAIEESFGIHVSSWRDLDWAQDHCAQLEEQGLSTWINRVRLEDEGIWHRVLVGRYATLDEAIEDRPAVLEQLDLERAVIYRLHPVHLAKSR